MARIVNRKEELLNMLTDISVLYEDWNHYSIHKFVSDSGFNASVSSTIVFQGLVKRKRITESDYQELLKLYPDLKRKGLRYLYKWDSIKPNMKMVDKLVEKYLQYIAQFNENQRLKKAEASAKLDKQDDIIPSITTTDSSININIEINGVKINITIPKPN